MAGSEFAVCRLKLGRAEEHFDSLKAEIALWKHSNPCVVAKKRDAEGSRHSFIIEIRNRPPLDRWSLIAGDCVHNLRTALDSLVYAIGIAVSGDNPPPEAHRLQFPIADTLELFVQQRSRIASLGASVNTRIEGAQPYRRPHQQLPPLLSLIRDFDNFDKHRLLNIVVASLTQGGITWKLSGDDQSTVTAGQHVGPVESGTEVAYHVVSPPKQEMDYEYEGTVEVAVAHAPAPSGRGFTQIEYVLTALLEEVHGIVERFEDILN